MYVGLLKGPDRFTSNFLLVGRAPPSGRYPSKRELSQRAEEESDANIRQRKDIIGKMSCRNALDVNQSSLGLLI